MFRTLLLAAALLVPTAAQADWKEARSKNFIVYSEGSEDGLRKAIGDLEKYQFMLRFVSGSTAAGSPVPLKVYLLRDMGAVARSMGSGAARDVAGYYSASSRGPIAVGTRMGSGGDNELNAQSVLLHEYAHHFMFQHFPAAYPSWYSEGFAEYYGTSRIFDNDVIEVGHAARHRYTSFQGNSWMPLDRLLTAKSYSDVGADLHLLYAQGWLLVHYLANNKERRGQLAAYLNALNSGVDYKKAMDDAFGPGARALNSELRAYASRSRINALRLPFKPIDVGAIALRALSPAEDALVEQEIALGRGVYARDAHAFADGVRRIAARYPRDPRALAVLAEAEYAVGDKAAALAAAERWLVAEPGAARAMMMKGRIAIDSLAAARSTDSNAWDSARAMIFDAHKAAPNDALILETYYDSFTAQGVLPPPVAQNALYRAHELVPQDRGLRSKLAGDFEARDMIPAAIAVIKPAAFQSHDSANETDRERAKREKEEERRREVGERVNGESAREMLQRLERKLAARPAAAAP